MIEVTQPLQKKFSFSQVDSKENSELTNGENSNCLKMAANQENIEDNVTNKDYFNNLDTTAHPKNKIEKKSNVEEIKMEKRLSIMQELNDKVMDMNFHSNERDDDHSPIQDVFGILNNLKTLRFDESSVSDSSPIERPNKNKNPITPGKDDMFPIMDFMWKGENHINPKFYPLKNKVCKDDSNANTPASPNNMSTFTNYLENNPMLRYFDTSPNQNKGGDTPKIDIAMLTKPSIFIQRSDKELTFRENPTEQNKRSNIPSKLNNPKLSKSSNSITKCENVNNAYINMNVNMNVLNGNPNFLLPHMDHINYSIGHSKTKSMNQPPNQQLSKNSLNHSPQSFHPLTTSSFNNEEYYDNNADENNLYQHNYLNQMISNRKYIKPSSPMLNSNYLENNNNNNQFLDYNNYNQHIPNSNNYNFSPYSLNNTFNNQNININNYFQYNDEYSGNLNSNQFSQNENYYNNNTFLNNTQQIYNNMSNFNVGSSNHNMNYGQIARNDLESVDPGVRELKGTKFVKNSIYNYMNMDNQELIQHSYFLSKDQAGCRYLQKKIDEDPEIVFYVYQKIVAYTIELMNDAFGNYLIQKILDFLPDDQFYQILAIINPYIVNIGTNPHGTRVIQKIIELLRSDELIICFLKILKPNVVTLLKDVNGNHIVQKFISLMDINYTKLIYDVINENIVEISTHKHGCCVLQKCIDSAKPNFRKLMVDNLISCSSTIILDQYGNYVVQYILLMNNFEYNKTLIENLMKDIKYFSKQKYSSNVVEKCFDCCDEKTRDKLIKSIVNAETISDLLLDMYGNYVLQKALALSNPEERQFFLITIAPLMEKLKFFNFGPKLYNKLVITYPQLSSMMFSLGGYMENCSENMVIQRSKSPNTNMNSTNYLNNNLKNSKNTLTPPHINNVSKMQAFYSMNSIGGNNNRQINQMLHSNNQWNGNQNYFGNFDGNY